VANFLFVLSRDDNQAATRCFQFAQIAHSIEELTVTERISYGRYN
jgi:hypothetical protein